jgi:FdhD protein
VKEVTQTVARQIWSKGQLQPDEDTIVTEVPAALVYNGISHAVMMVTPTDLEDFALGFSLTEGILKRREELLDLEIYEREHGIEIALTIGAAPFLPSRGDVAHWSGAAVAVFVVWSRCSRLFPASRA